MRHSCLLHFSTSQQRVNSKQLKFNSLMNGLSRKKGTVPKHLLNILLWQIRFLCPSSGVGIEECRPQRLHQSTKTSWKQFCAFLIAAAAYSNCMATEGKYYWYRMVWKKYIPLGSSKVELPSGGKGWQIFCPLITENIIWQSPHLILFCIWSIARY